MRQVDEALTALAHATGLACPPGCGACCANDKPRVSVNDVMPLAASLVARGLGESMLARAAADPAGICIAYVGDAVHGRCTEYALRPALCRLFGFAAVRDKHGQTALAACRVHKRTDPDAVARAQRAAAEGRVLVFSDVQRTFDGLGRPELAEPLPINEALANALERALLQADYAALEARSALAPVAPAAANDDDEDPREPEGSGPRPRLPPLAA